MISAHWRSEDDLWKVVIKDNISEEEKEVTCNFLFMCTGYYKYENGIPPIFQVLKILMAKLFILRIGLKT